MTKQLNYVLYGFLAYFSLFSAPLNAATPSASLNPQVELTYPVMDANTQMGRSNTSLKNAKSSIS